MLITQKNGSHGDSFIPRCQPVTRWPLITAPKHRHQNIRGNRQQNSRAITVRLMMLSRKKRERQAKAVATFTAENRPGQNTGCHGCCSCNPSGAEGNDKNGGTFSGGPIRSIRRTKSRMLKNNRGRRIRSKIKEPGLYRLTRLCRQ